MESFELKVGKEIGLVKKLNFSLGINLSLILMLSIYLFCSKNHYFFENRYVVEFSLGFVFIMFMLSNYILFLKSVKQLNSNLFTIIYRHLLNILFIGWMILAVFSNGAIEIGEISPLVYFFFLVELFLNLNQKRILKEKDFNRKNTEFKAMFFAMFTLIAVMFGYFYFAYDLKLSLHILLLNLLVFGIYLSLIAINAQQIFFIIFGKPKLKD
jgi:hypothetical protein